MLVAQKKSIKTARNQSLALTSGYSQNSEDIGADNNISPPASNLSVKAKVYLGLNIGFLITGIVFYVIYAPAHAIASLIYCMSLTLPVTAAVFWRTIDYARQAHAELMASKTRTGSKRRETYGLGQWAFDLFIFVNGLVWLGNVVFDQTAPTRQNYVVLSKYETHSRNSTREYAVVDLPDPSLSLILEAEKYLKSSILSAIGQPLINPSRTDDLEDVDVTESEYRALRSGSSQLVLNMHPGFLGLDWYEGMHQVINQNQTDHANDLQSSNQQFEKTARPDPVRLQDRLSKRAETLSGQMYGVYNASTSAVDRKALDDADIALSHIRWEFVYAQLPPDVYATLLQDLENLTMGRTLSPQEEKNWDNQTHEQIRKNRERLFGQDRGTTNNW
jgi:hypothetical protein